MAAVGSTDSYIMNKYAELKSNLVYKKKNEYWTGITRISSALNGIYFYVLEGLRDLAS